MSDNGTFERDARDDQGAKITNELPTVTNDSGRQANEQVAGARNERRNRNLLGRVREGWEVVGHVVRRAPGTSGSIIAATPADGFDALEDSPIPDDYLARDAAKWARRRDIPLAIIAWTGVLFIVLWGAGHIARTITLLIVAALLAYALAPAVSFLERWMPRFLATLLVYLVVLTALSGLVYFIVSAAVSQVQSLSDLITKVLTPASKTNSQTPLTQTLQSFGISSTQIDSFRSQLTSQIGNVATSIVPFLTEFFNVILDVILVAILKYLLACRWRARDKLVTPEYAPSAAWKNAFFDQYIATNCRWIYSWSIAALLFDWCAGWRRYDHSACTLRPFTRCSSVCLRVLFLL